MEMSTAILQYTDACKQKYPELASRVDRAAAIVKRGGYTRITDTTWVIPSSTGTMGYMVGAQCTCPDFTGVHPQTGELALIKDRAPRGWCKHRLAMLMLVKLATDTERDT